MVQIHRFEADLSVAQVMLFRSLAEQQLEIEQQHQQQQQQQDQQEQSISSSSSKAAAAAASASDAAFAPAAIPPLVTVLTNVVAVDASVPPPAPGKRERLKKQIEL